MEKIDVSTYVHPYVHEKPPKLVNKVVPPDQGIPRVPEL